MEISTQISKEGLGGQTTCGRVRIPERAMYESVRVKPKVQWRPQNVSKARNMECLLKKAIINDGTSPREEPRISYNQQSPRGRAAQAHWSSHHDIVCSGC
jgi:hypothetical protein